MPDENGENSADKPLRMPAPTVPPQPEPEPQKPSGKATRGVSTGIMERTLTMIATDRERDERQTTRTIEALERSASQWFRVAVVLIAVLGMIVAGLLGVGVTGTLPGIGEIHIEKS